MLSIFNFSNTVNAFVFVGFTVHEFLICSKFYWYMNFEKKKKRMIQNILQKEKQFYILLTLISCHKSMIDPLRQVVLYHK